MIEISPDIYLIPGKNKSRFPYCSCLYIKGREMRVLIDAGMGDENIAPAIKSGIDVLLLSHCHLDHRLTRRLIPDVPVWCHEKEAPYFQNRDYFYTVMGLKRSGLDTTALFDFAQGDLHVDIAHQLADGDRIDLGGITLQTIHTPGHTPGHISFFIPEHGLLFSGDVDLTPFGPFYGHDFADINNFLSSIEKLKQVGAREIVSGHAGPFNANLAERFNDYAEVIFSRDRLLLENLSGPKSIADFYGSNLFYKTYRDFPDLIRWFEIVHIEKHLNRLLAMGKVRHEGEKWLRA
jgi:glyoxylase-like metal-dependent hydrolase (beta-lactamase superfamily II)